LSGFITVTAQICQCFVRILCDDGELLLFFSRKSFLTNLGWCVSETALLCFFRCFPNFPRRSLFLTFFLPSDGSLGPFFSRPSPHRPTFFCRMGNYFICGWILIWSLPVPFLASGSWTVFLPPPHHWRVCIFQNGWTTLLYSRSSSSFLFSPRLFTAQVFSNPPQFIYRHSSVRMGLCPQPFPTLFPGALSWSPYPRFHNRCGTFTENFPLLLSFFLPLVASNLFFSLLCTVHFRHLLTEVSAFPPPSRSPGPLSRSYTRWRRPPVFFVSMRFFLIFTSIR